MWNSDKPLPLPKSRGTFYLTSSNGVPFYVQPGQAHYFTTTWNKLKNLKGLNRKIDRVVISQSGHYSIHLPKISSGLGIHENISNTFLCTISLPNQTASSNEKEFGNAIAPNGKHLLVTQPNIKLSGIPCCCCGGNDLDLSQCVHGIAASDTGKMIAVAINDQFWVWQQLPEETKGTGFWTNLSTDKEFSIEVQSYDKTNREKNKLSHGFLKPLQTFTIKTALAPNVPQNSAASYQDLCVFDNPDEGRGICCLTIVLPPSQPYDRLYLFNSVCVFHEYEPRYQRYESSIRIHEVKGSPSRPCLWWTQDGRYAVLAISQT